MTAKRDDGFTLIEIILVVALMAVVYATAMPQFGAITGSEMAVRMGQISSDVRSAFDMAVLNAKTYRLVFELASGSYYLEVAEEDHVLLGDKHLIHDPTEDEEKDAQAAFDESMKDYEKLAGEDYNDDTHEEVIHPTSPLLKAADRLRPAKWKRIDSIEWRDRNLGSKLVITDMQAEHHESKQTLEELGEKGRVMLYFFPAGYVERAVMHIAIRKGRNGIDESQPPYTLTTRPYEGDANVIATKEEIDVHEEPKT